MSDKTLLRAANLLSWVAIGMLVLAYFSFTNALKDATAPLLLHLAVLFSVIVTGLRFSAGHALRLPAGWTWLAAATLTFWALLSKLWADHPAFLNQPAYLQLEVFCLFLLMPQLVPDRERRGTLARVVLVASTGFAAAAIWSRLTGGGQHSQMGFGYPTGNPNLTTLLVEPGLILALGGACHLWFQARRAEAGLAALAFCVHALLVLLNRSLGGLLAACLGVLVLVMLLQHGWRRRLCLCLWLAVLVAMVGVFARPPAVVRESVQLRQALWRQAWGLVTSDASTVLFGRGLGNYLPAAIAYRHDDYFRQPVQTTTTPHPHNYLLRTAAELGLVGVLLLLALLGTLLERGVRLVRCREAPQRYCGAIGLAGLACLLVHAQLTWLLAHPLGLFLFWSWAGVLASPVEIEIPAESPRVGLGVAFVVPPVVMLSVAYALFVVLPLRGQLDVYQARQLIRQAGAPAGPAERVGLHRRAADFLARGLRRMTTRAETLESLMVRDQLGRARLIGGNPMRALDVWGQLESVCPGFGQTQWRIASAATMIRRPMLANRFYLLYFRRDPVQPAAYDEWWQHQDLLNTDARVVDQILGQLRRGAGLLPPGQRRQQLLDLQRRFEVLLQN